MKKILAVTLAILMTFGGFAVMACANDYTDTVLTTNAANELDLKSGDTYSLTFTGSGKYTFITEGSAKPTITVSYEQKASILNGFKSGTFSNDLAGSGTNVFDAYTFSSGTTYTITITGSGKATVWMIYASYKYSGINKQPSNAGTTFYEDIDYTTEISSDSVVSQVISTVNFTSGKPSFEGAEFTFRNDKGEDVYTLSGENVKKVCTTPTVTGGTVITYNVNADKFLNRNLITDGVNSIITVSYTGKPNPIKSVRVKSDPNADKKYHFGKDGTIKGKLGNYYFTPDVNFEGVVYTVTFKDYVTQANADIATEYTVQKDADGYYIEIEGYGRQNITCVAQVTENKTQTISANVTIGSATYGHSVNIEAANFFEMIGIFFGLLFGKYK